MLVNDCFRLKLVTYRLDQLGLNVLFYKCTAATAGNTYTAQDFANNYPVAVNVAYKPILVNDAEWLGVAAAYFTGGPTVEFINTAGAGFGSVAGPPMPTQITGMASKRSLTPGRKGIGRYYPSFPAEADDSGAGRPSAGYQTRVNTLNAALLAPIIINSHVGESVTLNLCLIDKQVPGNSPLVTSIVTRSSWGTQRRRGRFGKTNPRPF